MLGRATHISPRRFFGSFWPTPRAGLLPTLRAYSGRVIHHPQWEQAETLGWLGSLEVRLAHKAAEVRRAQKLRYRIFYKEGGAIADAATKFARRDVDAFDPLCDHLLVIDHAAQSSRLRKRPAVVGTYRLLRQEVAERHGGFYSESEFDVRALVERHRNLKFLELGRSCVLAPYRNKRTLELLWHGIGSYLVRTQSDVMLGCASLDGIDPERLKLQLSFLHHYARSPEQWRTSALPHRYIEMNRMPKDAIDPKAALRELPPLIKGYLRAGASIGDGAVIDYQFGTTDVLIVFPVEAIKSRYFAHFVSNASNPAG